MVTSRTRLAKRTRDVRGEHGVERLDIGGAAADHVPHRHAIEVARRQSLDVGEETYPESAEDALGNRGRQVAVQKRHRLDGGRGGQIQDGEERQPI